MQWSPEAHERIAAFVADLLAAEEQPTHTAASASKPLHPPASSRSPAGGG